MWDFIRAIPTHNFTPMHVQADRLCAERTAPYEEFLTVEPGDDTQLAAIRAAYDNRVARWREVNRSLWKDYDAVCLIKGTLAIGSAGSLAIFGVIPFAYVWAAIKRPLGLGTYARFCRSIENRTCPYCNYDLRIGWLDKPAGTTPLSASRDPGAQDPLKAAWRERVARIAGPAACPKCGEPWPLLPPHV